MARHGVVVKTLTGGPFCPGQVKLLLEVGYDAATNYKTEDIKEALPRLVPSGLDI